VSAVERLAQAFSTDVVGASERLVVERMRGALDADERFGWVTLDQAARLLGTTADAVRKRIERGTLPARKFEGRWYIEVAVLDRLIRESQLGGYDPLDT
jgi:excisionase family DNA binding protein